MTIVHSLQPYQASSSAILLTTVCKLQWPYLQRTLGIREITKLQFPCKSRYKSTGNLVGHLYQICFHM